MNTCWILVAHRSGARLFENNGPGTGLKLVEAIPHPEGRLKNREINADKPGRVFDSVGGGRHSMSKEHEPTEQVSRQFANQLSEKLHLGRTQNRYTQLILIAEPRFLGELRAALPPQTAALVIAELNKDLIDVDDRDLPSHLGEVIKL